MKKIINIFLILMFMVNFLLPLTVVTAATKYDVYMSYYDGDILLESFDDYSKALEKMKNTPSNEYGVAVIKKGDTIINADYALVETNYWQTVINDYEDNLSLYQDPSLVNANNANSYTYVNGGWGVDAAFLGYNSTYNMVKLKISGFTGWARLSSVKIVPISKFLRPRIEPIVSQGVNVRKEANTTSAVLSTVKFGEKFIIYPSKTINDGTYDWYYLPGKEGYVRADLVKISMENRIGTYYYAYNSGTGANVVKEIYHRYRTMIYGNEGNANFVIGRAPKEMTNVSNNETFKYYSFDGNYFYTDVLKMLDDYKNNIHENSINKDTPYFSYYMYVPSHSKTGYNAETFDMIIKNKGYTAQPSTEKVYAASCEWKTTLGERSGLSKMYGTGKYFIEAQEKYGINALLAFAKAISESATGTSLIAMQKNNLFGMGAYDKNPCINAHTYDTPRDSIMAYGASNSGYYSNPKSSVYAGSHYGNKASGMNVKYASDPYWGEKAAREAYLYDNMYGKLDYDSNTIGVKESSLEVAILKNPGAATISNVIYQTKNYTNSYYKIENLSFIVLDKVMYNDEYYYKIQTDPALDENQNMANVNYTFDNSYGYIKADYLKVYNNQPTLEATNKTVKQGEEIDLLSDVSATDIEDGKLTNITYDDNKVDYYVPGTYDVTYSVKDNNNFNKSVTVTLTVEKADNPVLTGEDATIPALKKYDMLTGITIYNNENIDKVTYTISKDNEEVTYEEMISQVGIYDVYYEAIDTFGNKSNIYERKVEVIENELPTITANDIKITQNSTIDLLSNVSATDKEDGVLLDITYETNLDIYTPGSYTVTYKVKDLDNQEVTKTVTITVEEMLYKEVNGYLHLDSLSYNEEINELDIKGFLNVTGVTIKKDTNIKYDLVLINELDKSSTIVSLDRLLINEPFDALNGNKSWFSGRIKLNDLASGNYKIYVRARVNDLETKKILTNVFFLSDIPSRFTDGTKGYSLRSDYSSKEMPLELYVRNDGIITNYNTSILYNMYNQYYKIAFDGSNLSLRGTSHSFKGDYSSKSNVEREIIFENVTTFERYKFDLGSITDGDYKVSLSVSDGFDKTKAWYDKTIDISSLEVGKYSIIIRTKTDNIDDYGELYDYMWSKIDFETTYTKDDKTYKAKIVRNNDIRMRLELIIEEA